MKQCEKMEKELRFVLIEEEYQTFKQRAQEHALLFRAGQTLVETTTMYDNPNPQYTFYSKEVDGRLRVRTALKGEAEIFPCETKMETAMLTWKQRVPELKDALLCQEKEIEATMSPNDMKALVSILENVLHCPRVSAYERKRETFYTDTVEIASDTFPYGHVVELELKNGGKEEDLYTVSKILGLDQCRNSTKSCDDMYRWLCEQTERSPQTDILFEDENMPTLDEVYGG